MQTNTPTLFLVISSMDYEGSRIESCHATLAGAQVAIIELATEDRSDDYLEIRAISPGVGSGVAIVTLRGEWVRSDDETVPSRKVWS